MLRRALIIIGMVASCVAYGEPKIKSEKLLYFERRLFSEHNRIFGKDSLIMQRIPTSDKDNFVKMLTDTGIFIGKSDKKRAEDWKSLVSMWKNIIKNINYAYDNLLQKNVVMCGQVNPKLRAKIKEDSFTWVKRDDQGRIIYFIDSSKLDLGEVKKAFGMSLQAGAAFQSRNDQLKRIIKAAEATKCLGSDCFERWSLVKTHATFLQATLDSLESSINGSKRSSLAEYLREPEVTCNS